MKLGTRKSNDLDGELVIVSDDNKYYIPVPQIAPNLISAIENWDKVKNQLQKISTDLNNGKIEQKISVDERNFHSPLPRTYQWLDGSAYIQHILLVRKARGAEPPATIREIPLMYQGGSDSFLAPHDDIPLLSFDHGLDLEGEVGIITDFVPMGTKSKDAHKHIKLLLLINDISLRGLIPGELSMGFGFLQGKPSSAFSPFALTPESLGENWKDGRFCLPLKSQVNGKWFGNPNAKEMFFSFYDLIEHASKTRSLAAGTIIGSGTVSNEDESVGSSCIAEKRMIEKIKNGKIETPFLNNGDTVRIEMFDQAGNNLFGSIYQKVVQI